MCHFRHITLLPWHNKNCSLASLNQYCLFFEIKTWNSKFSRLRDSKKDLVIFSQKLRFFERFVRLKWIYKHINLHIDTRHQYSSSSLVIINIKLYIIVETITNTNNRIFLSSSTTWCWVPRSLLRYYLYHISR